MSDRSVRLGLAALVLIVTGFAIAEIQDHQRLQARLDAICAAVECEAP